MLLRRIRRENGMAIVLVSHDMGVIAQACDRVAVMYAGTSSRWRRWRTSSPGRSIRTRRRCSRRSRVESRGPRGELRAIAGQPPEVSEQLPGLPVRAALPRTRARVQRRSRWSSSPSRPTASRPALRPLGRATKGGRIAERAEEAPRDRAAPRGPGALEVVLPAPLGGERTRARPAQRGGRRRLARAGARETLGIVGGVGQRQEDPRPLHRPAPRARRGSDRLRRDRRPRRRRRSCCERAAPDADGLPGPVHVAEPAAVGRRRDPRGRDGARADDEGDGEAFVAELLGMVGLSPRWPAAARASSPAVSASASRLRGRSPSGPTSSSATRR